MSARLCVYNTLGGLKLSTIKTIGPTGISTQLLEPHYLAFFVEKTAGMSIKMRLRLNYLMQLKKTTSVSVKMR